MNNNTLFLVAAIVAVVVMKKKTAAPVAPAGPAGPIATNVNNQLWTSILGGAWKSLISPSDSNDGFLMKNSVGQVVTSDGKPVNSVLPAISGAMSGSDYSQGYESVSTGGPDGTDWLAQMGW
jgi:hypothetical protein